MIAPHVLLDRRHGERRHDCTGCPAAGVHLGTRARMLPPLIAVLSISAVFAAGWVAGQSRVQAHRSFPVAEMSGPPVPQVKP